MEYITFILIIAGAIVACVAFGKLLLLVLNKNPSFTWKEFMQLYSEEFIKLTLILVIGILCVSIYPICKNYGEVSTETFTYKMYKKDNSYFKAANDNSIYIYVRGNAEDTIEKVHVNDPIFLVSENAEPICEKVKIKYKWFIFELLDFENYVYIHEY